MAKNQNTIEKRRREMEKKRKAEEKRKVEQKQKTEAEAEKKRLVELEKQRQEEARLAEIERQRQEEATKKRVEEEKKGKYTLLITEAEKAIKDKDKELAINKYNEALTMYPGDMVANTGMKEAEKLMEKQCYEILGEWVVFGGNMNIKTDGTLTMDNHKGTWKCLDPEEHTYFISTDYAILNEWEAILKEGGRCLTSNFPGICWRRPGSKSEDDNSKGSKISLQSLA